MLSETQNFFKEFILSRFDFPVMVKWNSLLLQDLESSAKEWYTKVITNFPKSRFHAIGHTITIVNQSELFKDLRYFYVKSWILPTYRKSIVWMLISYLRSLQYLAWIVTFINMLLLLKWASKIWLNIFLTVLRIL